MYMTMTYLNENAYFETTDLHLANTIYCFGGTIEAIHRKDPARATFVIKRDKGLDNLVQGYWSHSLSVDPLTFVHCLRELKTRLREEAR